MAVIGRSQMARNGALCPMFHGFPQASDMPRGSCLEENSTAGRSTMFASIFFLFV